MRDESTRSRSACTAELAGRRPDLPGRSPVFVVSAGRSGSNMLARVLGLHPQLCAFHEPLPHLNVEAFQRWRSPQRAGELRERVRTKRRRLIGQVHDNGLVYVESAHYLSHLIPELSALFDASYIHLVRDGREFVRSGLERGWYGRIPLRTRALAVFRRKFLVDLGDSWVDHRLVPPSRYRTRAERLAWLWNEITSDTLDHLRELPSDRWMRIRLEEVDHLAFGKLLGFLGVDADSRMIDEMVMLASERPNRTTHFSVERPAAWSEPESAAFWDIAGETMEKVGYYK